MKLEHAVRLMAGCMLLISLTLYYFVSPYWLFLALFVSLNLIQSAFTKWCLAEEIFKKLFFSKDTASADSTQKAVETL